jgi:hypothetical protein
MNFLDLVTKVLQEDLVAGGVNSVFGTNVGNTASAFSGDNYAKGDARIPKSLYSGVITRYGMKKYKKNHKKKR